jgi:D-lactate dehydrogenase
VLSAFIYSELDIQLLAKLPKLRLIATRSTGYDHIDLEACRARQIVVNNVPTYGVHTVAEHTFGLILALSRRIVQAHGRTLRGDFSMTGLRGFQLHGKVLGMIGAGRIGRQVMEIGDGFGMQVIAHDPHAETHAPGLAAAYVGFAELMSQADIVTLHCPLTEQTRHLIDRSAFQRMKRGTLLINTARGALVDTDALLWALDQGIVSGAGLDVVEGEDAIREERELLSGRYPLEKLRAVIRDHILMRDERVVLTPHIAFNSREAVEQILLTTADNISAFLAGTACNVVA